jgi:predicted DNA-binding transcriptional regulator AlpA
MLRAPQAHVKAEGGSMSEDGRPPYWTTKEVAAELGVSTGTVRKRGRTGEGFPKPETYGTALCLWDSGKILAWKERRAARWRTGDVAKALGVSQCTVWNRAARWPGFPQPVRDSAKGTTWSPEEVLAWKDADPCPGCLNARELARELGVCLTTVLNYARDPGFPKARKAMRNRVFWPREEALAWFAKRKGK